MKLALNQARISLGNTKHNPSVGCVIVKNNNVIRAGFTSFNGRPHAEHNALNTNSDEIKNSSLYVTLEPCAHYGKTYPCTNKIIKKKIKKVFFSINDPDLRSFNKSKKIFAKSGVKTNKGVLSEDINYFYRSYLKSKIENKPFVTSKFAISNDYFFKNNIKKWITNKYSRGRVHLMRANHDCLITSSETVIKDNPRLTCRIDGLQLRSPTKIILDNKLRVSLKSKIFMDANISNTLIFYNKSNKKKINKLNKMKIKTIKVKLDENGNLDLDHVLAKINELGFSRVFLECGMTLNSGFFKKNLINDFKLFISQKNLGKKGKGKIKKHLNHFLKNKKKIFENVNLAGDKLLSYKII